MPDHLLQWWRTRDQVDWASAARPVAGPILSPRDAFVDFASSLQYRDAERGRRLRSALSRAGAAADTGEELSFTLLAGWQEHLLGEPAAFRTDAAFAKGGRERYGLRPDTRDRFDDCLAEAADPRVPLAARAARLYLDLAFVHPFPDGNARTALLALYFTLRRDGLMIDSLTPALRAVRRPDDLPGTLAFVRLLELLIAATARRAAGAHTSA